MNKLLTFTEQQAKSPIFHIADDLLHTKCLNIPDVIAALVKVTGTSELFAKSVIVHVKVNRYLYR